MPLDLIHWDAVVRKKKIQSTEFKNLDRAVRIYLTDPNKEKNIRALSECWTTWNIKFNKKNKTYKNSDRYTINCALDDIASLNRQGQHRVSPALFEVINPEKNRQVLQQKNAFQSDTRPGGNEFRKEGNKWVQKIFNQEETYSCTCGCATTFLSKLINETISEDAFKKKYNEVNLVQHNFNVRGTTWNPICMTLKAFGADVTFNQTINWSTLSNYLEKGTPKVPVLFGIQWDNGGSPGGGHAVMCVGKGLIQNSPHGPADGFLIEDPWSDHRSPGLLLNGEYYVQNIRNNQWSKGNARPEWGCITGKIIKRETVRYAKANKVGWKMPGM